MDKVIFSVTCYPTMICFKFYKLKLTIYGMCKQLKRCIGDMKEYPNKPFQTFFKH